jgi:P4 family phage/plasmid primase-like protien
VSDNVNATWAKFYVTKRRWKLTPIHVIVNGRCSCTQPVCDESNWGKHPVLRGWTDVENMVASEEDVLRWWGSGGIPYSLGLPTGEVNNVLILDVDPRNGGFESLKELEAQLGPLPYTLMSETGGGGLHYFFKYPHGTTIKSRTLHSDLPGLDIKANGGQIVIPPSLHRSGKRYGWADGRTGAESVTALPESTVEAFEKIQRGSGGGAEGVGTAVDINALYRDGIPDGKRNETLHRAAVSVSRKMGAETGDPAVIAMVKAMIETLNMKACRPPLPDSEIDKIVRSAVEFVINTPKDSPGSDPAITEFVNARRVEAKAAETVEVVETPLPEARVTPPSPAPATPAPLTGVVTPGPVSYETPPEAEEDEYDDVLDATEDVEPSLDEWLEAAGGDDDPDAPGFGVTPHGGLRRTLTDVGNSRRLIDYFGDDLRHTVGMGWSVWAGDHLGWRPDPADNSATERSKAIGSMIAIEASLEPDKDKASAIQKWAKDSRSIGKVKASIDLAKSDRRVSVQAEAWDGDRDRLGTRNGVINLVTGSLEPHSRDVYVRNHVAVEYRPGTRDPRFETFLEQATNGDRDLALWLQRAAGYTLTGHTSEQVFFLVYGPPGSGKGTFIDIIGEALGEYRLALERDSIMQGRRDGTNSLHEYTAAAIAGKRMLIVSELPEADKMKEAAVKALSGEDIIRGRHLRESEFYFRPNAKLWIGTNHRPIIDDPGIWRRMRAIPFTYEPPVKDATLKTYLLDKDGGLPAVLAWAVEGAVEWNRRRMEDRAGGSGLGACKIIDESGAEYKKSEDRLGIFFDDETDPTPGATVPVIDVHKRYTAWSNEREERPMTSIAFTRKLGERGMTLTGTGKAAVLHGITLKPAASGWGAMIDSARW